MGALMRAHDWSTSPIGHPDTWPQALRSAVSLILPNKQILFVAWGPELAFLYNDAYRPVFGKKHPWALGRPFREIWSEVWDEVAPLVDTALGGEATWSEDLHLVLERNGYPEDCWFTFSYSPARDENGKIAGLFCAATETTSRVLADAQLIDHATELERRVAERTAEYARVWNNSHDILVIAGTDGVFHAVSPAWTTVLGHEPSEVEGRSFRDFVWEDHTEETAEAVKAAAAGVDVEGFENLYRHKDGSLRCLTWRTSEEGGLIYAYARDVTEQKAQAEDLQGVAESLRQAQKMEAVGQLTGGIAHDFNNMLTGVIGGLDIVRRRLRDGRHDDVDRFIDVAYQSAERAATLTKRLLAFSRRQSLEPKILDVNVLAAGLYDMLQRTLGESTPLTLALQPDIWPIEADAGQLENSLLNLTINARDAMPDGGTLTIETINVTVDAADPDLPPGDYVRISVSDEGIGMSQAVLDRAFDPVFTTKAIGQGTGLGLSMIYGFVKQSHGHVAIDSAPGQGTRIKLWLPRAAGDVALDDLSVAAVATRPRAGTTVMIVEDEPSVRLLIGEVLTELGYEFVEAANGDAALPILRSDQRIDLLVSDVGLPGMNGRQLAEMARAIRPGLKVLFVTAYAEGAVVRGGFLDDGMDMVAKPFSVDVLAEKIHSMVLDA